jgi:F-type H+-transporting ATPase subunit delta
MSELRAAHRYAKALIDLAVEQKNIEVVKTDLELFRTTLRANANLLQVVKSPVVSNNDKIVILNKIFGQSMHPSTMSFFNLVVRKNRSYILKEIYEAFIDQYNQIHNIITATVKTALPIDAAVAQEVTRFVEKQSGKKVTLNTITDPSLIGGLVIQIGDNLYDASVSGKINKIRQNLLNTYISK